MTRKRKSGFLTFCFSFLPGAGEMYLGFMKMGVSLMSLFLGIIIASILLNLGIIMFAEVVIWFYSFFHVHNLAGMSDEEFLNTEDAYLFNLDKFFKDDKTTEKYRNIIAVVLIAVGVLCLWNGLKSAFMPWIPDFIFQVLSRFENTIMRIVLGVGIIIAGFRMIKGKQEELKEVIIDVEPENVKEKGGYSRDRQSAGADFTQGMQADNGVYAQGTQDVSGNFAEKADSAGQWGQGMDLVPAAAERKGYGTEAERKDS